MNRESLLHEYGQFYGEQHFAVTFTSTTEGDGAKRVTTKGWDKTAPLADGPFGAALLAGRGEQRNPAIVLRASNLIVLECDTEDDLVRIEELGLPVTITVRSSQPYKRHYYFRPAPELEALPYVAFRFESGKLTADTGRYFLAPPSIHPSGAVYAFLPGRGPGDIDLATLPEALYRDLAQQARVESNSQREAIADDPAAKIHAGNRREMIFRYACMQRRWGIPYQQIVENCQAFNLAKCDPPVSRDQVATQVSGAMKKSGGQELGTNGASPIDESPLRFVSLREFISVTEDVAEPLLGNGDDALLPAGGLLLMYGDGGAGKTTLSIDGLAHAASGTDWLGIPIRRALRAILIENEGPRGPFRRKVELKASGWQHGDFLDNVQTLEEPWTRFTLKDAGLRKHLAAAIEVHGAELVMVGPLASLGAKGTGTPDDVNEFTALIDDLKSQTEQEFALWIVHHENKAGDVSGAWERVPDTLVHVSAQGNGRTRVAWRKVRWSSTLHNTSSQLLWADNAGFTLDEARERDYPAELIEAFRGDDRWRTAKQSAALIAANVDKVRTALAELVTAGDMRFEIGPEGRNANAHCWRLRTDSDPPSHPESQGSPEVLVGWTDSVTPPIKESPESSQYHNDGLGDSDPPSQTTSNGRFHDTEPEDDDEPF